MNTSNFIQQLNQTLDQQAGDSDFTIARLCQKYIVSKNQYTSRKIYRHLYIKNYRLQKAACLSKT